MKERIIFYDFEVLPNYFTVHFLWNGKHYDIDNQKDLENFINNAKDKVIFIGYNSSGYDKYISQVVLNSPDFMAAKVAYDVTQDIIQNQEPGWKVLKKYGLDSFIEIKNVDLMSEIISRISLKTIEANLGLNIHEAPIPFDKPITTTQEIMTLREYNKADVLATELLFDKRQDWFNAKLLLVQHYKLEIRDLELSFGRLAEKILKAERRTFNHTISYTPPSVLQIGRYQNILDLFKTTCDVGSDEVSIFKKEFKVAGLIQTTGAGGGHSAEENVYYHTSDDYLIFSDDAKSYYPTLTRLFGFLSRGINDKQEYENINRQLWEMDKKNPIRDSLKKINNTVVGLCKDKTSKLYDPTANFNVCVSGQLFLLDLIEKLETLHSFKLIQNNTDGLIYKINAVEFEKLQQIRNEFISRTNIQMELERIDWIWQKDVNNYVASIEGKIKAKGGLVGQWKGGNFERNTASIIDKAIVNLLAFKKPISETIRNFDNNLIEYQYIIKGGNGYNKITGERHGIHTTFQKVNRGFASENGYTMYKWKGETKQEKVANVPKVVIENGEIKGTLRDNLNIPINFNWYISETLRRLRMMLNDENYKIMIKYK